MSEPSESGGTDTPARQPAPVVRVTEHERAQVVRQLQLSLDDGSLDLMELDRRLATVYAAQSRAELEAVTSDLPVAVASEPLVLSVASGSVRKEGRWVVPADITASTASGSIRLDFTEAVCAAPVVELHAGVASGSIRITIPRGWRVNADNVAIVSGSVKNKATEPPLPGYPTLRVDGSVASGSIRIGYPKPPRRSFLSWLLRRPR